MTEDKSEPNDNKGTDTRTCDDCVWKPRGGAGNCRNPATIIDDKKKPVTYLTPAGNCFCPKPTISAQQSPTNALIGKSVDEILTMANRGFKTMLDNHDMFTYHPELGYWVRDGKEMITTYCSDRDIINTVQARNNIFMNIEGQTYTERNKPDIYKDGIVVKRGFQPMKGFVNLGNGVLKLETMELLPFGMKYNFRNKISINYNPDAECELFKKFLDAIKPEKKEQDLLQEWFGYQLDDEMPAKVFYLAVGKSLELVNLLYLTL